MRRYLLPLLLVCTPPEAVAGETTFVIGSRPWNFPQRSREHHLSMQLAGPDYARGTQGAGSAAPTAGSSYPGLPIISNSYAIGNWIQVDMNLAAGAEGLIMIENHQTNDGNQQSLSDVLGEIIDTLQQNKR